MDPDEAEALPRQLDPPGIVPGTAQIGGPHQGRVMTRPARSASAVRRQALDALASAVRVQAALAKGRAVRVGKKGTRALVPTARDAIAAAEFLRRLGMEAALTSSDLRRRMGAQVRAIARWQERWAIPQDQVDDLLLRITEAWQ